MITYNSDILKIANQACLKIVADDTIVDIKHKLRLTDKSTFGVILFLFGGLFFIITPFVKTSDTATKVIGIVIGLLLFLISIITLIQQVADGLTIKGNILSFRHNFKQRQITLNGQIKLTMKVEVMKIRRTGTLGSDFIVVTHFLQDKNEVFPILKFQMENSNGEKARKLGNELARIINSKLEESNYKQT